MKIQLKYKELENWWKICGVMFRGVFLMLFLTIASNGIVRADEIPAAELTVDGCELKEPVYDYTFNLTALHSEFGHRVKNENGDNIEFNVCGGLSKKCGDKDNIGACLTKKDGKSLVLGKSSKLHYANGKMFYLFADDEKCSGDKNYTLYVTLSCDYTVDKEQFTLISTDDSECTFYIKWETPYACLPLPPYLQSNTCSAMDSTTGHKFNLMPLSDFNYRISDRNGSYFIINVCKPVLYGQDEMCPADSGVCYIDYGAKDLKHKYINYGSAQSEPILENGQLVMKYNSSTKCNDKENISSVIYFVCERDSKYGLPEYTKRNGCQYEFSWFTQLACNYVKPCTALNPSTGKEYDFNTIAGVYNATQGDQHYLIGVCKDIGMPCASNDGACELGQNNQTVSLGKSSTEIQVNETGSPFATYTSGSKCDNSQNWTTTIEFICSQNETDQGPQIIENSKCHLIIHFKTNLACNKKIVCKAKDTDRTIDLTPLISNTENYVATVNGTAVKDAPSQVKYYLNVCRPLVSQYGLSCPGGSAACKAIVNETGNPEQEQSLGYPMNSLISSPNKVTIKYTFGDTCPDDQSEKMSANIEFKCAQGAGKGNPILQSILRKCHYQFDWPTSVVCPSEQCNFFTNNCTTTNPGTGKTFNFRNAKFTNNGDITIDAKPKSFNVSLCSANQTVFADYSDSVMKIYLVASGPCGVGGLINIQLRLVCSATEGEFVQYETGACNIIISKQTPEVCEFLGLPVQSIPSTTSTVAPSSTTAAATTPSTTPSATPSTTPSTTPVATAAPTPPGSTGGGHPSETKSRMVTTAATVIGVTMVVFVIMSILCLRDPGRRMAVKNFFRRNSPSVLYRRVNTGEEANLLLTQNQPMTDSDDDMIL